MPFVTMSERQGVTDDQWRNFCRRVSFKFSKHFLARQRERNVKISNHDIKHGDNLQVFKESRLYTNTNYYVTAYLVSYVSNQNKRIDTWFLHKNKQSVLMGITTLSCPVHGRGYLNSGTNRKYTGNI